MLFILTESFSKYYIIILRVYSRVESAHSAIKKHLGGKRTKGSLLTTWLNLEAAILTQVLEIKVKDSSEQDRIPLYLDRMLFRGVSGIIT
jgi:hypothetical protein